MKPTRHDELKRRRLKRCGLSVESLETRRLLAGDPILEGQPLIISEFVADSNASLLTRTRGSAALPFENGPESPDWIELLNVSGQRLDIGGMHLTDDATNPTLWDFPEGTTIDAGAFLVVFASGDDISDSSLDEQGLLHTSFRLSGDGEYLALTDRDGVVIHEFSPSFPAQRTDVSHSVPMEVRTLVAADAPVEYVVPTDNSLEPQWRLSGFTDAQLVGGAGGVASPIGFDRGVGEEVEQAETIGADPIDRASVDFSRGSIVVLESAPFTTAGAVADWSFYSDKTRSITPLVLKAVDDDFEIVGVGQTRVSDGTGTQAFAFELQSGSDAVEPTGYFFGFKDGDNQADDPGVVRYGRSTVDSVRRYNGPLSGSVVVQSTLSGGREFGRTYSVQATTRSRLAGPINTDVGAAMTNATSLYVRYPFDAGTADTLKTLSLRVRYDDGFVAYLNGTEVARRNVPDAVQFDSTAISNRPLKDANRFEEINVSQFIGDLIDGENVLAIHALNDRRDGAEFFVDAQLVGYDISSIANIGFASETTPGLANQVVFSGFVETTSFSRTRGFYDESFALQLSTPGAPDATIYFTTDGTEPTPNNPNAVVYQQPVEIASTTNVRAAGYQDGLLPSRPMTHTYIFAAEIASADTLNEVVAGNPVWGPQLADSLKAVPTLSLVTAESISVDGEFATSAELIFADGSVGFQVDAGVEVFGGTAVSFPKRSMRLSFKNQYGPSSFKYDLFGDADGVTEFDQLILRAGSQDTPFWDGAEGPGVYIRNRWTNDRQLDMGQPAPRGRFVQLYLNGEYWGQYQLMERPNAAFMASNFGGDKSDYDVLNAGTPTDGDTVAWNALLDALGEGYDEVKKYLDVVNYADYILLEFFGGNTIDWRSASNWMAGRRREPGAGFQFFAWDSDIVLRTGADSDIVNFGGPGFLGTRDGGVQQYPEFRRLLAERAQLYFFDDGLFTDERLRSQIDELQTRLEVSIIADTARWGSGLYTPETWRTGMEWIKDTYAPVDGPSRSATVIEQMRHAGLFPLSDQPQFTADGQILEGSEVSEGDRLAMFAPEGIVYYTLDGSDPWAQQPTLSYTSLVSESAPAQVLIPSDGSLRKDWIAQGFDDSTWISGRNGIGYDTTGEFTPLIELDVQEQMQNVNASAYARFNFQVDDPSQFDSLEFSVRYDDGFVAYLNGVEVARRNAPGGSLAWSSRARRAHANIEAIEFERFNLSRELNLLQPGNNVLAIQGLNTEPSNVDFLMTPMLRAGTVTNSGILPTAVAYSDPFTVPPGATIKARTLWGDQWSTLREVTVSAEPLPLRVSEVMYNPGDPTESERVAGYNDADEFEFIELVNISDASIDLAGVQFVQTVVGGQTQGVSFDFGRGTIQQLGPGQRVLVVENRLAFAFRYGNDLPVAGQWIGGLSNRSEQITVAVGDQTLQQFTYDDAWYPATDGRGMALQIVDAAGDLPSWNQRVGWRASVLGGTPGRDANAAVFGDSNRDGVFDSNDLVLVLQAGEYEDGVPGNSTFEEGDWNGDGDFSSADLIAAMQSGNYVAAARPVNSELAAAVDAMFASENSKARAYLP